MSILSGEKNTCSFAVLRDLSGAIILRIKMQKLPLASLNKNWQDFFLHISGESGLNMWSVVNPRFQTFVNWHLNVWFKWEYFTQECRSSLMSLTLHASRQRVEAFFVPWNFSFFHCCRSPESKLTSYKRRFDSFLLNHFKDDLRIRKWIKDSNLSA